MIIQKVLIWFLRPSLKLFISWHCPFKPSRYEMRVREKDTAAQVSSWVWWLKLSRCEWVGFGRLKVNRSEVYKMNGRPALVTQLAWALKSNTSWRTKNSSRGEHRGPHGGQWTQKNKGCAISVCQAITSWAVWQLVNYQLLFAIACMYKRCSIMYRH